MAITASVEIVLPAEDHQQFDTYYSRWLEYRHTNNRDKVVAMEKRMRDVMSRNNIPRMCGDSNGCSARLGQTTTHSSWATGQHPMAEGEGEKAQVAVPRADRNAKAARSRDWEKSSAQ